MSVTKSRPRKAGAPKGANAARQARQVRGENYRELLLTSAAPTPRVEPSPPPRRLLSRKQVCELVGLSYPTIWDHMRQGTFPQSRAVGGRTFWLSNEIDAWIEALPKRQLKPLDDVVA